MSDTGKRTRTQKMDWKWPTIIAIIVLGALVCWILNVFSTLLTILTFCLSILLTFLPTTILAKNKPVSMAWVILIVVAIFLIAIAYLPWDLDDNNLSNFTEHLHGLNPNGATEIDEATKKAISDCSIIDWKQSQDYVKDKLPDNTDGDSFFDLSETKGTQREDYTSIPKTDCYQDPSDTNEISPHEEKLQVSLNEQSHTAIVHPRSEDDNEEVARTLKWENFQLPDNSVSNYELIFIVRRLGDYDDTTRQPCKVVNRKIRYNTCSILDETLFRLSEIAKSRDEKTLEVVWNVNAIDKNESASHLLFPKDASNVVLPTITFSFQYE
ncbi:MAG: hypothetical protein PHN33_03435 [Candidatus Peribacteraceae bacterium]|nr:hypothetical protein [Candidatus Peribacteraceae bacterium]